MGEQVWLRVHKAPLLTGWLLIFLAVSAAQAETPAEKGYAVAARSDRSDRGFGDSDVNLKMVLRNAAGKQATR